MPRSSRPGAPVMTAIPSSRGARLIASRSISDPPRERNPVRPGVASGPRTPRRLAATTMTSAPLPGKTPARTGAEVRPNPNGRLAAASVQIGPAGAGACSGYRRLAQTATLEAAATAGCSDFWDRDALGDLA